MSDKAVYFYSPTESIAAEVRNVWGSFLRSSGLIFYYSQLDFQAGIGQRDTYHVFTIQTLGSWHRWFGDSNGRTIVAVFYPAILEKNFHLFLAVI